VTSRDGTAPIRRRILAGLGALAVAVAGLAAPTAAIAAGPEPLPAPTAKTAKAYDRPLAGSHLVKGKPAARPSGKAPAKTKVKPVQKLLATSCTGNPDGVCHFYAGAFQNITSPDAITGFGLRMWVGKPVVRTWDTFSLVQNAVQNGGTGDIVEAGWVVYPGLCGGTQANAKFFTSSWTGGVHNGWGTSFVPVGGAAMTNCTDVNSMVGDGEGFRVFWQVQDTGAADDGWHLFYSKVTGSTPVDIGYYPESLWPGGFTSPDVDLVQGFGEVAVGQTPSQSGMGANSLLAANRLTASSWQFSGGSAPAASATKTTTGPPLDPEKWDADVLSASSFNVGGPGGWEKILSTTSPSADDCSGTGTGTNPSGQGAFCTYSTITSAPVPAGKVTQIDGSAGTACRGNVGTSQGYAAIRMVAMTLPWRVTVYPNGTCTGSGLTLNHGRIVLPTTPTNYQALANFSYKVLGTSNTVATTAACATNGTIIWPAYQPTC
jgi:hypothetical protein